jgi:hypothetical protein
MRPRALVTAVAIMAAFVALGTVQLTLARFVDSATVTGRFATTQLEPPANLVATGGSSAVLEWTPTTTTWASGYDVLRSATSGSGYASVGSVSPASAASTTDSPGSGTWYYVLRSVLHNWSSARSNEASVVVGSASVTTPAAGCRSNAPVTVNAGDNDGYQTGAADACDLDGSYAVDASTGTDTSDSCTAAAKDRHDFWGYAFGLPATVGAIEGITVRPTAGMNNNGGTTRICVQLSGDAGASWTDPLSVVLSDQAMTTYAIGGAAETWGHAWTASELDPALFRLRVIDSSTHPRKDIRLDAILVEITYVP